MSVAFTKGPWIANGEGREVRADGGRMKVCDIRGWGYLTGKGDALGLPDKQAIAIQTANERLIAAAPDYHAAAAKFLEVFGRDTLLQLDPELSEVAAMFEAANAQVQP